MFFIGTVLDACSQFGFLRHRASSQTCQCFYRGLRHRASPDAGFSAAVPVPDEWQEGFTPPCIGGCVYTAGVRHRCKFASGRCRILGEARIQSCFLLWWWRLAHERRLHGPRREKGFAFPDCLMPLRRRTVRRRFASSRWWLLVRMCFDCVLFLSVGFKACHQLVVVTLGRPRLRGGFELNQVSVLSSPWDSSLKQVSRVLFGPPTPPSWLHFVVPKFVEFLSRALGLRSCQLACRNLGLSLFGSCHVRRDTAPSGHRIQKVAEEKCVPIALRLIFL